MKKIKQICCHIPFVRKWVKPLEALRNETENQRREIAEFRQAVAEEHERVQRIEEYAATWSRFYYHALPQQPVCEYAFAPGGGIRRNDELVSRIATIAEARPVAQSGKRYVWDVITDGHVAYAALNHEKLSLLAASPLTNGLLQGDAMTALLRESAQQRAHWTHAALDGLLSLCEALELIPLENIELNARYAVEQETPDTLLDAVSRRVGFEVLAPDVFVDCFGLKTKRGIFTFRHFIALYAAWRLAEKFHNKKDVRIAEIGAGAGLTAYYARQFGFTDYSIFDLPTVNSVQSWFLGQSLPDSPLILADDPSPFTREGFRVLPPEFLAGAPDGFWDVAVNIDSIPEIDPDIVAGYLDTLYSKTLYIYSYNHEARPPLDGHSYCGLDAPKGASALRQEPTARHMAANGGYTRLSRNRAFLRPGYVEEWYASNTDRSLESCEAIE